MIERTKNAIPVVREVEEFLWQLGPQTRRQLTALLGDKVPVSTISSVLAHSRNIERVTSGANYRSLYRLTAKYCEERDLLEEKISEALRQ